MKLWRLIGDGALQNVLSIHEQGDVAEQILKIIKGEEN
jgi:hypothetical protein